MAILFAQINGDVVRVPEESAKITRFSGMGTGRAARSLTASDFVRDDEEPDRGKESLCLANKWHFEELGNIAGICRNVNRVGVF